MRSISFDYGKTMAVVVVGSAGEIDFAASFNSMGILSCLLDYYLSVVDLAVVERVVGSDKLYDGQVGYFIERCDKLCVPVVVVPPSVWKNSFAKARKIDCGSKHVVECARFNYYARYKVGKGGKGGIQ